MKLKDFLTLKVGAGVLVSGTRYNPLINYDWSTTTAKEYKTDGVELVTNGGFDIDVSGWLTSSGGAHTWNSGRLEIRRDGRGNGFPKALQKLSLEANSLYLVKATCISSTTGAYEVYMDTVREGGTINQGNIPIGKEIVRYITVTSSTGIMLSGSGFSLSNTDDVVVFDNISVQKVIEEPNKRYLKDVGSTPTYNASMYFGRGAYLNGVDQTITVPINTTIQTALKRVNGVVTINETSQTLTNYVISGLGVHKDYYLFTRLLTTAEKDSYTNTPELFYAMAQADNTCVLNMPMCETDGYARNMKSYSEGSELVTVVNGYGKNTVTKTNDVYTITVIDDIKGCFITIPNVLIGDKVLISYKIISSTATAGNIFSWFGSTKIEPISTFSHINTSTRTSGDTRFEGLNTGAVITFKVSVKKLTGVSFIQNYASSVRDNAKNLQYGLQTCKFVRDSLGVIQSASDYLECDGVGYGNTGWNSVASEEKTIEYIVKELLRNSTNNENIVTDGKNETNLYSRFNPNKTNSIGTNINLNGYTAVTFNNVVHITIVLKINGFELFKDGVSQGFKNATGSISGLTDVIIGTEISHTRTLSSPIRLFKVHSKALTQAEITKNYNSYVAKGLLT